MSQSPIDTGGTAFGYGGEYIEGYWSGQEGMDLRDHFAGQAISGIIRQCAFDTSINGIAMDPADYFAMKAYEVADAMIRQKRAGEAVNKAVRQKREADDCLPF